MHLFDVPVEVGPLVGRMWAQRALVGPFSSVDPGMALEGVIPLEAPPAHRAGVAC